MSKICIHIPDSEMVETVGVEVTVGNERRLANYRVESFEWPEHMTSMQRVDLLREFVYNYEPGWQLVQIGPAVRDKVPVTFVQKSSTASQLIELEETPPNALNV
jgi:hypothetical protein